jgi:chromate transporter
MVITLCRLFWACFKIGILAFGGGNAAIPLLESEAVPQWLTTKEFGELVGVNFALPGVSILKLAGMVGLRAAGIPGLIVCIVALALPGLLLTIAAYAFLGSMRQNPFVARALLAMQFAAVALLASSALTMLRTASGARSQPVALAMTAAVFGLAYWGKVTPALIVVVSVAAGVVVL